MARKVTAKELFQGLKLIPAEERQKILESISTNAFRDEERSYEKLFAHLYGARGYGGFYVDI